MRKTERKKPIGGRIRGLARSWGFIAAMVLIVVCLLITWISVSRKVKTLRGDSCQSLVESIIPLKKEDQIKLAHCITYLETGHILAYYGTDLSVGYAMEATKTTLLGAGWKPEDKYLVKKRGNVTYTILFFPMDNGFVMSHLSGGYRGNTTSRDQIKTFQSSIVDSQ